MAKHSQSHLWGGENEFAVQYGRGAGGANLAFGSYSSNSYDSASIPDISADMSHKAWRVLDVLTVHPWECLDAQMLLMRTEASHDVALVGGTVTDVWTSVGMRPTYHFTDHLALAYEVGYDRITHSYDSLQPALLKQTLAFEVINGRTYDARPALRFFITHARWNDDARVMADSMVAAGLDPTSGVYTLSSKGAFNTHTRGTTFGVQVEAWW
jgi:maltoporin